MDTRPLFIPVILGTVRKGRASENVAKFVFGEVQKREGVGTELIDIRDLNFPVDDAGEQIKDAGFSQAIHERWSRGKPFRRFPKDLCRSQTQLPR